MEEIFVFSRLKALDNIGQNLTGLLENFRPQQKHLYF